MEIKSAVTINGKTDTYATADVIAHAASTVVPELADVKLGDLTPEHVDIMRERIAAALKETAKKVTADLDRLEEIASARVAAAKAKEREADARKAVSEF